MTARNASDQISDRDLTELIARTEEATSAFMQGDMDRYLALTEHVHGFTLANPFGGPPVGYDDRSDSVRAASDYFTGGQAALEVVQAHAWGDTVVLVMIERQHGRVGGLPDQDWSLRVTQVYRREHERWKVVHRHADPLVHRLGLDDAAALARTVVTTP